MNGIEGSLCGRVYPGYDSYQMVATASFFLLIMIGHVGTIVGLPISSQLVGNNVCEGTRKHTTMAVVVHTGGGADRRLYVE